LAGKFLRVILESQCSSKYIVEGGEEEEEKEQEFITRY
jgi:hypothetical protein